MPILQKHIHLWNDWVAQHPHGSLFQTSAWAHFQQQLPGRGKTWIITNTDRIEDGGGVIVKHELPFGRSWLECPSGPLFPATTTATTPRKLTDTLNSFITALSPLAAAENAIFVRINLPIHNDDTGAGALHVNELRVALTSAKFKRAHQTHIPEHTIIVDLTPTEDKILARMKPKGRYNIGLAKRHNIIIEKAPASDIPIFYKLLQSTGERDQFGIHAESHYKTMLDSLGEHAQLFIAYIPADTANPAATRIPVAGLIATYFGDTATYYYGASSYEHRALMAPYLLHWNVMREAKNRGYKRYDLFGIAPENDPTHPWRSITDFKTKFGGDRITYLPTMEYIFKPAWYAALRAAKFLRRK